MARARTLVTGATGFVGRALALALAEAGHAVTALGRGDGDVTDPATWGQLPAVEHVFHLAGRNFVPDSWHDPAGFLHANVTGTARALDYCRSTGAHLVLASTALFGTARRLPIREEDVVEPSNPYALSKLLAERSCAFYASAFNVPVTVIRLVNVFGPGQRAEFLIPAIMDQVRRGQRIHVKILATRRDFVFIDDAVAGLAAAITRPGGYRIFNVGSGVSHSVQEVVDIVQKAAGTQLPVVSDETLRANEIEDVRVDITRVHDLLGWAPRVTLEQGIARLCHGQGERR